MKCHCGSNWLPVNAMPLFLEDSLKILIPESLLKIEFHNNLVKANRKLSHFQKVKIKIIVILLFAVFPAAVDIPANSLFVP